MLNQTISSLARLVARWRPDGFTLLLLGISMLGVSLVLLRGATYGPALTSDSIYYIDAARNILAGDGFVGAIGEHYTSWPPLYPMLLVAASLFVFDPIDIAGSVNAAVFGLTVFIAGRYLRQRLESKFMVLWGSLALVLSTPLAWMASWVFSESLFILLVTLALIATDRFLNDGRGFQLVAVAVLTALVCLTRYIGIALVGAVVLLLIFQPVASVPEKLRRIAVYSLISLAPVGLWMLRNLLLTGHPTGPRTADISYTMGEILDGMHDVAKSWLFLDLLAGSAERISALIAGTAMLGLVLGVGYVLITSLRKTEVWGVWRPFCIAGVFALVYIACLAVSLMAGTTGRTGHGVEPRFLAPAYLLLLFAGLFALDRLLSYAGHRRMTANEGGMSVIRTFVQGEGIASIRDLPWLPIIAALSLFLWLAYSATLHIHEIKAANMTGARVYYSFKKTHSEVMEYLKAVSVDSMIISNHRYVIYIHTDDPSKNIGFHRNLRQQLYHSSADGDYVVWFYNFYEPYMVSNLGYNHMFLRALPELRLVADLSDGVVFEVDRSYMDDPISQQFPDPSDEPAIRAFFDLYLVDDTLVYIREQCSDEDAEARFFLHIVPTRHADLPEHRQQHGFDNLDFSFTRHGHGWDLDGRCVVTRDLPEYDISSIRTGQFVSGSGQLWGVELPVDE